MTMGLFRKTDATPNAEKPSIIAQYAPQVLSTPLLTSIVPTQSITRELALEIPSVVRARNLICGTIASMPLELYRKSTGEEIAKPVWLDSPAVNQPRSVTIAYTVDSLLFYGWAVWLIKSRYQEDGRPASYEWIPNTRVNPYYSGDGHTIEGYYIDQIFYTNDDVVTFQSLSDGILSMGARVLRAALDLEVASSNAAATPMPTGVLRNNGADLDPKEVQGLLAAWKSARSSRSTAYLTSTLEYQPTSFTPKDMMYNEAKQDYATQIARLCNVDAFYLSADANNSMTYSNLLDSRKQFVSLTLQPFICAIEDRLSMNDVTAMGNEVRFDLDASFLRANPMDDLLVIEKMLALGLIDINQAMEMTDLTPNGNNGMS
jgi:HK97 family phage portal protein